MKRTLALVLLTTVLACHRGESTTATTESSATTTASAATPAATQTSVTENNAEDLAGLAQGAMVVSSPASYSEAYYMLDEDPRAGWSADSVVGKPVVIALAQRSAIERVSFDTSNAEYEGQVPRNVVVEMSDTSATDGFKPIANVTLADTGKDGQTFPADANVPGRWLRLTIKSAGSSATTQLGEFRAFGKKLSNDAIAPITGVYETPYRNFHLKQDGTRVTGCVEDLDVTINGGLEGHVVRFQWDFPEDKGPALMVFSPDASTMFGGWWKTNGVSDKPTMTAFTARRISNDPGSCPQWKAKPEAEMEKALQDEKRLRLYGINFDSDSDHLRDESKPTLDLVVTVLKAHADWKLAIEGHTDSTSTPEHNQDLSTRRAESVKQYLTSAGIDASRLTPQGLGSTKPVAPNDNALGRAANRRVELVRM
ncbi:MAG TPA: OmpA family protein [Thermoanaerobaculia bacterium]|nr:OmpA family protein [Thermoanaerobaculia bacterium]